MRLVVGGGRSALWVCVARAGATELAPLQAFPMCNQHGDSIPRKGSQFPKNASNRFPCKASPTRRGTVHQLHFSPCSVGFSLSPSVPKRCMSGGQAEVSAAPAAAADTPDEAGRGAENHHAEGSTASTQPAATADGEFQGIRHGTHAELNEVLELVEQKKGMDVVVLDSDVYQAMRVLCRHMVVLTCLSRSVCAWLLLHFFLFWP
jgi:hypothetical protein